MNQFSVISTRCGVDVRSEVCVHVVLRVKTGSQTRKTAPSSPGTTTTMSSLCLHSPLEEVLPGLAISVVDRAPSPKNCQNTFGMCIFRHKKRDSNNSSFERRSIPPLVGPLEFGDSLVGFTVLEVGSTLLTTLSATQGVWTTGSCPTPSERDPGLHRANSHALGPNSSWQPMCPRTHARSRETPCNDNPPTRGRPERRVWPQTCRAILHCRIGHRGLRSMTEELGGFRAHKWECLRDLDAAGPFPLTEAFVPNGISVVAWSGSRRKHPLQPLGRILVMISTSWRP